MGSVQTLIEHPMTQKHKSYNDKDWKDAAIANNLIRLACGIEDVNYLINYLKTALNKI